MFGCGKSGPVYFSRSAWKRTSSNVGSVSARHILARPEYNALTDGSLQSRVSLIDNHLSSISFIRSIWFCRAMEDSISRPMFVLLRCFAEMVDDDSKSRAPIAELLVELYKLQPKMGYFLLYFLRARY